jgi:hypothetical protein
VLKPHNPQFSRYTNVAADDDDNPDGKAKEGRASGQAKISKITALRKASTPVGRFAAFRKKVHKKLFGWMDPR